MAGGIVVDYPGARKPVSSNPLASFGNPGSYTAAATTQAGDYDKIMNDYRNFAVNLSTLPTQTLTSIAPQVIAPQNITPQTVTPTTTQYSQSGDTTKALGNLSDLSTTGGLSDADIQNIRARDISPIRAIYANAQRNIDRQRALTGGYSPNYNAVTAKLSRDLSDEIANKTIDANAGIAELQQKGKLSAAPEYASASSAEASRKAGIDQANTGIINQINEGNANRTLATNEFNTSTGLATANANADRTLSANEASINRILEDALSRRSTGLGAISGQASLYGTTPALTRTFGDQVVQAAQLGQNQLGLNQQGNRDLLSLISQYR